MNNVLRTVCDEKGSGSDIVSRNRLRPKISCPNYSRFVNPQSVLIAFYVLILVELFIKNFFATPPFHPIRLSNAGVCDRPPRDSTYSSVISLV